MTILFIGLTISNIAHAGAGASVEAKQSQDTCEHARGVLNDIGRGISETARSTHEVIQVAARGTQGEIQKAAKSTEAGINRTASRAKRDVINAAEMTASGLGTVGRTVGEAALQGAHLIQQAADHPVTKDIVKIGVQLAGAAKSAAAPIPSVHISFNFAPTHVTVNHSHFSTPQPDQENHDK